MSRVINRKNIVVFVDLATAYKWSQQLNLNFQPDTMVVKLINCLGPGDSSLRSNEVQLIKCCNINEYIGSVFDGSTSNPNLTFDVSRATFNTNWEFELHEAINKIRSLPFATTISLHLEFLQHEK